ncbi:hypothetical protein G7Z17_g2605 [Cylindrodendrum hubeiense]|uniref:Metallo-beta-lactamase domain-containing protein n=1 Tax=Cylindrodendrum hubeiense TaxID=595255 RepID=A0A9P5HHB1_9HYPO|nr:hypothetical protein G7Z17_g2605 [Cylindrodendrum hubeiense]
MIRASVVCISHGGGPLPVIGGPGHKDIVYSLKNRVPKILKLGTPEAPRAIVCVTAHWSETQPTVSSADHHDLYFDYGGLPREAYRLKYDAPGSSIIAEDVRKVLAEEGLAPVLNTRRGWDHGVFIPFMLINPAADIPIIQLSILLSEDAAEHLRMGRALSKLRDSNIAILGSGFASIHNNRVVVPMMLSDQRAPTKMAKIVSEWNVALTAMVTKEKRQDRVAVLEGWRNLIHSYDMHPRGAADHFMPLLVCAGAANDEVAGMYKDDFLGLDIWTYYWEMTPQPTLEVPASSSTVQVRVIDTTSHIRGPMNTALDSPVKGHEYLDCPSFSFLVEHQYGRKVLFDLGLRKDWENLAPIVVSHLKKDGWELSAQKGVHEVLEDHGVDRGRIEAIIWSHWHFDHTGDPSVFPPSTALIVGPGFKDIFMPGYPKREGLPVLESDFAGREVKEVKFSEDGPKIGNFNAIDYFDDGSFYILDGPGHTIGHMCAFARVTCSPDSFIFMGGDCCHHAGELRPSSYFPLPDFITPNPLSTRSVDPCPGGLFEHLLRNGGREKPFYGQPRPGMLLSDPDAAERTIKNVQDFDANKSVFVMIAHDTHLDGVIDFFPKYANDFMVNGWLENMRWAFLKDFSGALLT